MANSKIEILLKEKACYNAFVFLFENIKTHLELPLLDANNIVSLSLSTTSAGVTFNNWQSRGDSQ